MAQAECVVLPNIETAAREIEGFGLSAVEAAASGGVVVAARHSGLNDSVIDGETGILVPSGDADAWARKINQILGWTDNQRTEFTSRATAKCKEYFNWARVAAETASQYGRTAG